MLPRFHRRQRDGERKKESARGRERGAGADVYVKVYARACDEERHRRTEWEECAERSTVSSILILVYSAIIRGGKRGAASRSNYREGD